MQIDRAGFPFIGAALLIAAAGALTGYRVLALAFGVLTLFFVFFFRDPDRHTQAEPDDVISPADGRVLIAGDSEPEGAPPGTWQQVSIFLSPLDVHINRIPASGRIERVVRIPGRFLPAYSKQAASQNERTEIWIDRGGQTVICRQVVGVLARRIVCRIDEGAQVTAGQRYGLMKFGSRMDLYLPPGTNIAVHVGDTVRGGVTRLATLPPIGRRV
jgi:phosphatidylserine decarboxylase